MSTLETASSPVLVGRSREMAFLDQALRAAQNGAGRCVLLEGEAGIGKSRLASELCARASGARFVILKGHCSEPDNSFPYAPWIDALRTFLATKSTAAASDLLGPLAAEIVKLLPELSLLIPSLQPTPSLEPEAEKHRLHESLLRFHASLAAANPLLIILEDLHWSDEASLELLHIFAQRVAALPVLLIGTLRTDELYSRVTHHLARLKREHLFEEVQVDPLGRREVEQMARAILTERQAVADDWLDSVMALTEGNPFFVEEILKSMPESAGPDRIPIPRSVQDAVQQRVEQLPAATRQALSYAAIMGERFEYESLREITGQDEPSLLRMLKDLVAAQLIVEKSADEFAFRHALTREAVVAMLLLRERKAMHRAAGEAMARVGGAQTNARAAELGYHFYQAGVWDRAIEFSERAGQEAQVMFAPREALAHFTRACDAAQQLGVSPARSILRGRAQAHEMLGEFERARAFYESALELAHRENDRESEWQSLIDLGFRWQSRDWVRAGDYYDRAMELARSLGDKALVAHGLKRIGNWHANRGQPREALSFHVQALELFRELVDTRGEAQTLDLMTFDCFVLGDLIQGAAYCEQAVPLLRELDDRQGLVNTLQYLSLRPRFDTEVMGELDLYKLANISETAYEIAHRCVYRKGEADALSKAALCYLRAGDFARGIASLRLATSIAEEIKHQQMLTTLHLCYGIELYPGLLAFAKAREHLEAALASAEALGSMTLALIATAQLASICVQQRDFARVEEVIGKVLRTELPDEQDMPFTLRGCWAARAELALARGNAGYARDIVDRLLAGTINLGRYGPHSVPRLAWLRGNALAMLGRTEEAIPELQGALQVTRQQGQRPIEWRLRVDLGKLHLAEGHRDEAEREFSSARAMIEDLGHNVPDEPLRDEFVKRATEKVPHALALTPRRAAMKEFGGLTEREREIAVLIARGKSNREIAEALVITVRTVEAHVTRILIKLNLKSRTEIATWAVTRGL